MDIRTVIWVALGIGAYEATLQVKEYQERQTFWEEAQTYKEKTQKPLLRIGARRSFLEPPNGDTTIDIDDAVTKLEGGVAGDVRDMHMFRDKRFSVAFCEHVLEHLHTQEDVDRAIAECNRVADYSVFLTPSPYGIWATFLCQTHYLRIFWISKKRGLEKAKVVPNSFRTGIGASPSIITDEGAKVGSRYWGNEARGNQ